MKKILWLTVFFCTISLLLAGCGKTVQFKLNFIVDGEIYATIDTAGNEAISLPQNPTKDGETFDGWYWDNGTWQKPFTANSLLDAPLSSDMNVYAKWKSDGTSVKAPAFTMDGKNLYLSVSNKAESFSFIGQITVGEGGTWQISTDIYGMNTIPSKTAPLQIGDNIFYLLVTMGNDVDLYTVTIRRRPIYTVTFGTANGTAVAAQQVEEESLATVPATVPKRTAYTFANWEFDFSKPIMENTVISAAWNPTAYTITYNLNGGTNAASNPATYTIESDTIIFAAPTRTGYTFAGWSVSSVPAGSTGNKTVTATWTPTVYTITYNLVGGTNVANNPAIYTIESNEIMLSAPSRNGYTFLGWTYEGQTEPLIAVAIPSGSFGNKTFTATWSEPIVYTITYDLAGGTLAENPNPTSYTIENETMVIEGIPSRPGCVFTGWSPASITKGSYGDQTVTATWQSAFFYQSNGTITGLTDEGKAQTVLEIPSEINGVAITSIGNNAFQECTGLTSVTIPNSVTRIGNGAFNGGGDLTPNDGLSFLTVTSSNLRYYNYYYGISTTGLYITASTLNSAIHSLDCVSKVNGIVVNSIEDYNFAIKELAIGDIITMEYIRYSGKTGTTYTTSIILQGYIPNNTSDTEIQTSCSRSGLTEIIFDGTIEQWNAISKGECWNGNTESYTVHCTDGDIAKS